MIVKEIQTDTLVEEMQLIVDHLYEWAVPKIRKGIVAGLPEYYKGLLAERAFHPNCPDNDLEEVR